VLPRIAKASRSTSSISSVLCLVGEWLFSRLFFDVLQSMGVRSGHRHLLISNSNFIFFQVHIFFQGEGFLIKAVLDFISSADALRYSSQNNKTKEPEVGTWNSWVNPGPRHPHTGDAE
jgi:hypothetical protein